MKKAVANVTVKIDRVIYEKGTVFTAPFPPGVQKEIDARTGTVSELVSGAPRQAAAIEMLHRQPVSVSDKELGDEIESEFGDDALDELYGEDVYAEPEPEAPEVVTADKAPEVEIESVEMSVESNAVKRTRLIREAQERFGVKIDKRKSLAQVESLMNELIAQNEQLNESPDTSDTPDLSEI